MKNVSWVQIISHRNIPSVFFSPSPRQLGGRFLVQEINTKSRTTSPPSIGAFCINFSYKQFHLERKINLNVKAG